MLRDAGLCVSLAWAAGLSGQFQWMGPWLDAADRSIDDGPTLEGWHTLRGAVATLRGVEYSIAPADMEAAVLASTEGCRLESDPTVAGYIMARTVLGAVLGLSGRSDEAVRVLDGVWDRARAIGLPPLLGLQAASIQAMVLGETGRTDQLRRLLAEIAPVVRDAEERWGNAIAPGIACLRTVEGELAHRDGDLAGAAALRRAAGLARTYGEPVAHVAALTALAEVELDGNDRAAARAALAEARDVVDNEPVAPATVRRLDAVELRAGRTAVREARRGGALVEELTDREQSILRALSGDATQREIGAALHLSINTVKGSTKVLYRKLGVATRQDAVREPGRWVCSDPTFHPGGAHERWCAPTPPAATVTARCSSILRRPSCATTNPPWPGRWSTGWSGSPRCGRCNAAASCPRKSPDA